MAEILLLEPNYKNKYPPIGLMKIATYHKTRGDNVRFFKGDLKTLSLELRFDYCYRELKRIKGAEWNKSKSDIKKYLQTKHLLYLNLILTKIPENKRTEVEAILRDYSKNVPQDHWDRIYIATLFTFYWDITIKTIEFAKTLITDVKKIFIGGVMASLLKNEIYESTGIMPFAGLLDKPGMLHEEDTQIIDELPLDYSILGEIEYIYPTQSAYFTYMTKGCTRKCAFCSVPKLEPTYKNKIESKDKFEFVKEKFGEQRNLLLMDNNVLASEKFPEIIQEIKDMGFHNGAIYKEPNQLEIAVKNLRDKTNDKAYLNRSFALIHNLKSRIKGDILNSYNLAIDKYELNDIETTTKKNIIKAYKEISSTYEMYRYKSNLIRYVDFNQGTDARYVTEDNMRLMSEIPIKPLRIAFDNVAIKKIYINAVELAAKYGITGLSNYILYNFHDKPEDFYERLKINVDLGKRLNIKIFSFPMKYIPLFGEEAKHRRYIGTHWNKKFIRAIQSILNATKGIVAPGYEYFQMAFGNSMDDFLELLWMPEAYIINRNYFIKNGMTDRWREDYYCLDGLDKIYAREIIKENEFNDIQSKTSNNKVLRLLSHYTNTKDDKRIIDIEVRKLRNKFNRLIKNDMFIDLTLTHDFDNKGQSNLTV